MSNFITNSPEGVTLHNRLQQIIPISQELKFLVGFFYFSGWQEIYTYLEANTEIKVKILVGLSVDKTISGKLVEIGFEDENQSRDEVFSSFIDSLDNALNSADMDNESFHEQFNFFVKLIKDKRLEIKKTKKPNHAKIYLFVYGSAKAQETRKKGQTITGSSNLTQAGLKGQEEFNVEITDYGFEEAERYFDERWQNADAITEEEINRQYLLDFLKNKTQASFITPFEAYTYILKTYLDVNKIERNDDSLDMILDKIGFEKYAYQKDAVHQALHILKQHNGVILADVVGLGKSVIASMIARKIGKRGLILCPPGLIGNKNQNTGWYEYVNRFELNCHIESTGQVETISEAMKNSYFDYDFIIVDEAHRFRNQDTKMYAALDLICRGKQVILLTATPFNNSPADIFSLLKLFIVPAKSSLTMENDVENLFSFYTSRFKKLSTILKDYQSKEAYKKKRAEKLYKEIFENKPPIDVLLVKSEVKSIANQIKDTIREVTIRRNRLDLKEDITYQKEIKNLSEVEDPKEIFYELSNSQSAFYNRVINDYFGENGEFTGAIYRPNEYEKAKKDEDKKNEEENRVYQQQQNLYNFMRRLLVKRFESSFGAFDKSIKRFLKVHKMVKSFIEESGKYILDRKVIEVIYNEDEEDGDFALGAIEKALENFEENAKNKTAPKHTTIYEVDTFKYKKAFLANIQKDIELFEKIHSQIIEFDLIENDPKRKKIVETVKEILKINENQNTQKRKVILFTEYTDTVRHLESYFSKEFGGRILFCDGSLSKEKHTLLNTNFNAKHNKQEDDFDVLITSDKLSEGFNLNRAGLIINYDIPWNPTRVIQRVGRINRIGTKVFERLFIYNFFPTQQGADIVKSREIAAQKMFLIHNALGEDAKIFDNEEEPSASGLFERIGKFEQNEKIHIDTFIRNEFHLISQNYPQVIERINQFPNRTKTAKSFTENNTVVLRRKGKSLFPLLAKKQENGKIEIQKSTFEQLIDLTKCNFETPREPLSKEFWKNYEVAKNYNPKSKKATSQISLEQQAQNSLKMLSKEYKNELETDLLAFVAILLDDIRNYKTLPTFTLRKLILPNETPKGIKILVKAIEEVQKQLGQNYLEIVKQRIQKLDEDIIISVENQIVSNNLL